MIIFLSICVITVSVVAGIYGIVLLRNLRVTGKSDFFNSFFYYHLLIVVFGVYGILGSAFIREILQKLEPSGNMIEIVAQFIPFIGVPFLIAAWYIFLKMMFELGEKKLPQWMAILYFFLCTFGFLTYGYLIKTLITSKSYNLHDLHKYIRVVFYSVEILLNVITTVFLILYSTSAKLKHQRLFLARFAIIALSLAILKGITLQFADSYLVSKYYYVLFYFSGNLVLIFLARSYFSGVISPAMDNFNLADLYEKFGITQREREIIEQICLGKTNKEIASELFITLQTVKDHTYNIFRKVNVTNRVQLVQLFSTR